MKEKGYSMRLQEETRNGMAEMLRSSGGKYETIKEYGLPILKEMISKNKKQLKLEKINKLSGDELTDAVLSFEPKTLQEYSQANESHKQYYACREAFEKAKAMRRDGDMQGAENCISNFLTPIIKKNVYADAETGDEIDRELKDDAEYMNKVEESALKIVGSCSAIRQSYIENEIKKAKEKFEKSFRDDKSKKEYASKLV